MSVFVLHFFWVTFSRFSKFVIAFLRAQAVCIDTCCLLNLLAAFVFAVGCFNYIQYNYCIPLWFQNNQLSWVLMCCGQTFTFCYHFACQKILWILSDHEFVTLSICMINLILNILKAWYNLICVKSAVKSLSTNQLKK